MCYYQYEIDERDSTGSTALMNAVRDTYGSLVTLLLHRGADPNIPDIYGDTPLDIAKYIAKRSGNTEIVELLVAYGAKCKDGPSNWEMMEEAVSQGKADVQRELLPVGANSDF
jgi:ankyrin repeat protein